MSFPNNVKMDALVDCGRHCCICHRFCGTKIEIHHIKLATEGGADTLENAIPLCFDCHADMRSYDSKHPKGTKYTENELKRHRDNWFKKVEGISGLARPEEAAATDNMVYEALVKVLPWDGSLHFIRHNNFAGFPFELERLKDLYEFEYECESPSFEFIDPDLEGLRVSLRDHIVKFKKLLEYETFTTNTIGWNSVPAEWEHEQSERFERIVNGLHNATKLVCDSYDSLVKLATRKLGTIPALRLGAEQSGKAKEHDDFLENLKETVENSYTIHQRVTLSPNIQKALSEEGSKGWNLPTGTLAGRLFDIYLGEIAVFTSLIIKAATSYMPNLETTSTNERFGEFVAEMLVNHNVSMKKCHAEFVGQLFDRNGSQHSDLSINNFSKQVDIETKLRCKELFASLNFKNFEICSNMQIPSEAPVKEEQKIIQAHQYTENE